MSGHTLNDGITPDPRITQDSFDGHLIELAPPRVLLGDYYKRGLPWEEFEKRYNAVLERPEKHQLIVELSKFALLQDITLLCIESTAEHCHRRLIAEACKKVRPGLIVVHK